MKKYLLILFIFFSLTLGGQDIKADWIGIDNLDTYNVLDTTITGLGGGTGWSGNWATANTSMIIQTAPAGGQGGKAWASIAGVQNVNRTVTTPAATGTVCVDVYTSQVNGAGNPYGLTMYNQAGTNSIICNLGQNTSGYFGCYNGSTSTYQDVGSEVTGNAWFTLAIKYGTNTDKYQASVVAYGSANSFSADKGVNGTFTTIDKLTLDDQVAGAHTAYWDNITGTCPPAVATLIQTSIIGLVKAFWFW